MLCMIEGEYQKIRLFLSCIHVIIVGFCFSDKRDVDGEISNRENESRENIAKNHNV